MAETELPQQRPKPLFDEQQPPFLQRQREDEQPAKGNLLYFLQCYTCGSSPNISEYATFNLSTFCENNETPTRERVNWLVLLAKRMRAMPQYNWLQRYYQSAGQTFEEESTEYADGEAVVYISAKNMAAWLILLPPMNGGLPVTTTQINMQLEEKHVVYGVDYARIAKACNNGEYLVLMQIAQGTMPTNGTDGFVTDYFKRTTEIEYAVREDGSIDYRELGWLQTINAGQLICEAAPPTPHTDGMNVLGAKIPAHAGKVVRLPAGTGTCVSSDGTQLLAKVDGVISFTRGQFNVDQLLKIHGDVDNSVGNLDVLGNLMVYGSVKDGYTIKATGDITIKGTVEAATVISGGRMNIGLGVNGRGNCTITAEGDIRSPFFEYATINTKGSVNCDYIVGCTVTADDSVYAKYGRAAIIGGSIYARNCVETQTIGTHAGRSIDIVLGVTAEFLCEKLALEESIRAHQKDIDLKKKNLDYLLETYSMRTKDDELEIGDLKTSIAFIKRKCAAAEENLAALIENIGDLTNCRLAAKEINPPLKLTIGVQQTAVNQVYNYVEFYFNDGRIDIKNTGRVLFG